MKKNWYKWFSLPLMLSTIVSSTALLSSCGSHHNGEQNTWAAYKKLALKETAQSLKSQISNLDELYWKTSDVAIFSSNGYPKQAGSAEEIVATIIIQNQPLADSYPIKFIVDYTLGDTYEVSDWSHSQSSYVNDFEHFQASVKAETASALLAEAKASSDWASLKWYTNKVWQASDLAEFDTFGALNNKDPYQGMNGKPTTNTTTTIASAIISVKGKEGVYGAMPIKATITYNSEISYNANSWHFSAMHQLQSQLKYVDVMNKQADAVYSKIQNSNSNAWNQLLNNNWLDTQHTKLLKDGAIAGKYDVNTIEQFTSITNPLNVLPNKSGIQTQVIINLHNSNGGNQQTYTLLRNFNYAKSVIGQTIPKVGYCFDYTWNSATL